MSFACLVSPVLYQLASHQSFYLGEAVTSYILWNGWCCVLQAVLGSDATCQLGNRRMGPKELLAGFDCTQISCYKLQSNEVKMSAAT